MKKWFRLVSTLVLVVMVMAPLASTFTAPEVEAQGETITIAWIPKALNNPVFELGRDGCMQAAAELTENTDYTVECLYMGSVASDMAEQARVIEDAISQNVNAIGVSCNDPDGCVDPINAAMDASIPTMTWDSDSPDSNRITYLGVDNYTGGVAAANLLIEEMGTEGQVALLTGVPGAFNLEERIRGFKDGVAGTDIEIVTTVACNDDINLGVQVVEETMLANPELDGWFFVGLWPVFAGRGAMPLFEEAVMENDMKAVAFDTLPVELEWVQDGLLHGLVGQKYWGWGYDTVYMLFDHITKGADYDDWTDSGMDIVTANNVDAMATAWETSDFTQPLPPAYPPEDGTFTIAWIPKALNNPVFELGRDGCMQAAAEMSEMYEGLDVECLYMGSVASDMAEQARVIEDAISQGVDAIGVSCNDPDGCVDPINAAMDAGIPTMTWDSDSPDSNRFTYLGVNNYDGGYAAGELLVKAMGTEGKVALLTGVPGAFNLEERIRGFEDYVAQYPDIEIVTTVACNDDINLGVQVVEETMLANSDLDGWFFVGLWPVFAGRGAMPLFEDAVLNGDMKAVAFDTLPVELEWVQDGLLHGLVGQKYWGWGYDTVYMAFSHVLNLYPYPDWTDSGMDIVTIHNVDAMVEMWETSDFTQPLPPAFPEE
jgi:ABC-type sugar transport system substrate-binding protein